MAHCVGREVAVGMSLRLDGAQSRGKSESMTADEEKEERQGT
jgi:hypothetical protein